MKKFRSVKIAAVVSVVALLASTPAYAGVSITGAGATFPGSLISACIPGFQSASGNTVTYGGGGSGVGRKNADLGIGDFNFSDVPYTGASSTLINIPAISAPIAIAYNLNDGSASSKAQPQLFLSQETISDIFAGKITKWNDAAIKKDNNKSVSHTVITFKKDAKGKVLRDPKTKKPIVASKVTTKSNVVSLPNEDIRVVYRSDSSGTTQNLVNFLENQFPKIWDHSGGGNGLFVSGSFAVNFPGNGNQPGNIPSSFLSASGSSGVAALTANTPFAITYVEAGYATSAKLGLASVNNSAGNWQAPNAAGVSAFLGEASITSNGILNYDFNTKNPGAYVLGIASYGLVDPKAQSTDAQVAATKAFFKYLTSDACVNAKPELGYSLLTGKVLDKVNALIEQIK